MSLASSIGRNQSHTLGGSLTGMAGNVAGSMATPALLSSLGIDSALATGTGVASALGLGASMGSIVPGIGTAIGAIVGSLASSMMRKNASAIQDISGALRSGKQVTPQQWSQAGYGPGGQYLSGAQLLAIPHSDRNASPLHDIAAALYQGNTISAKSWAQAGLPADGGPYGQLLQSQIAGMRNAPDAARQQIASMPPQQQQAPMPSVMNQPPQARPAYGINMNMTPPNSLMPMGG